MKNIKTTSSKNSGKSNVLSNNNSDNDVDYKNSSAVDSRSKSTSNKVNESGNK